MDLISSETLSFTDSSNEAVDTILFQYLSMWKRHNRMTLSGKTVSNDLNSVKSLTITIIGGSSITRVFSYGKIIEQTLYLSIITLGR